MAISSVVVMTLLLILRGRISTSMEIMIYSTCINQSSPCPTISNLTVPTTPNVTLVFSPGVHYISSRIFFQRKSFWEFKASSGQATLYCNTRQSGFNIVVLVNSKFKISDLTFACCKIQFFETNLTSIVNTQFIGGELQFFRNYIVSIDRSLFNRNSFCTGTITGFYETKGVSISRSNFTNNYAPWSSSGILIIDASNAFIGCCNFIRNSVGRNNGIVLLKGGSSLYFANSTMSYNSISAFSGVISLTSVNDNVVVVSSVFDNSIRVHAGEVIELGSALASATILASKFLGNRGDSVIYSLSNDVTIDCSEFPVSTIPTGFVRHNRDLCKLHKRSSLATCLNTSCNCELTLYLKN